MTKTDEQQTAAAG